MTIDFRAEVDKRKDALMEDLLVFALLTQNVMIVRLMISIPFGPGSSKSFGTFSCFSRTMAIKLVILIIMQVL